MEDLVRSLRSLGLKPPSSSLLVDLLESDGDPAAQKRLADLLALEKLNDDDDNEDEDIFITPDVVRGALLSLLDSFSRTLSRSRDLHKREYAAFLQSQQQQPDRKKKPIKPVPRAALLNRQTSDIRRAQEEWNASLGRTTNDKGRPCRPLPLPRLILDGAPYFTSTTALDQLERISIADLEAPSHFKGRYLLCRVISAPLIYVGATFIVDDPAGHAIPLSIAHFTDHLNLSPSSPKLLRLLPRGTVLAIREPYVSNNHHVSAGGPILGKAATGIRVSSPSDVVVLERDDARLRDVEWKLPLEAGGDGPQLEEHVWMREGICTRAILSKSDRHVQLPAREVVVDQIVDLLDQHRSGAAYRELVAARRLSILSDLGKGGSEDEQQVAELEASILHQLRAYDALRQLRARCSEHGLIIPNEQQSILAKISSYRYEDSSASYKAASSSDASKLAPSDTLIKELYTLDRTPTVLTPQPELYGQDYISPALTIQSIPGAGRGLVTNRDVGPGELLLCCRAVEPCFAEDERWAGVQILRLGLSVGGEDGVDPGAEGVSVTTTQVMACTRLVHALADRPELRPAVLGLTAGPHLPYSDYAKEETYPLLTEAVLDPSLALDRYQQPDIDAKYVDGVLQHNAFGPGRDVDIEDLDDAGDNQKSMTPRVAPASADLARASMPHPLPAILNHRCIPNVSSVFLGPIILTRALIPLPQNTEIVHQYVSGERPFSIRSAQLSKHGFECGCVLCELERAEGKDRVRRRVEVKEGKMGAVLERARMLFKNKKAGLIEGGGQSDGRQDEDEADEDLANAFEGIVDDIEGTYGDKRTPWSKTDLVVLKPELFDPLVMLARHWRSRPQGWWKSVEYEIKALRSVGAIIDPSWLSPVLRLVDCQRSMLRIARTIYAQQPESSAAAEQWVEASYTLSRYMLGGGLSVYLDMMRCARLSDEWELQDDVNEKLRKESGMVAEDVVLEKLQAKFGAAPDLESLAIK
ncbi:hypothetical protein OC861_000939 [Tilletia horrida]|nr:hypothetical protein OC861_000939 [Tilletia horrida]